MGGERERETVPVAKVIECAQARYEVQDVEFGKVYKWRPERIVVECQCGQRLSLPLDDLVPRVRQGSCAIR